MFLDGGFESIMSVRAISIHGHFYQPPREDPTTGLIPTEAGASPFTNWNERIHSECYLPNARLGNFGKISYNIGPTLFSWMKSFDRATARSIVEQDTINTQQIGVGNAIAQPYHHTILPLASKEDKITQVEWGIAAFEHHFGRKPIGMWLPETAVDLETLNIIAEHGIEFTILAPWQADCAELDVTEPYGVALPAGRDISIFFYHKGLSTGISFNPELTVNADEFVTNSVLRSYLGEKQQKGEPQLLLIASDGELYGHHQQFRDRFLAHLIDGASSRVGLDTTYPALWLKKYPAKKWINIREDTSWSCMHGIERWKNGCACTEANGNWKGYLRRAFDRLADEIDNIYIHKMAEYQIDPLRLRNEFIHVILGEQPLNELVYHIAGRRLDERAVETINLLLLAQWEKQRIFTSCGWYFDDFSRIEPRNNIAYAAQAIRLTYMATRMDLSGQILDDLKSVHSQNVNLRGDQVLLKEIQKPLPAQLFDEIQ